MRRLARSGRLVATVSLLCVLIGALFQGCSRKTRAIEAGTSSASTSIQQTSFPLAARVYCVDISRSPLPGQFEEFKEALVASVEKDVSYDDAIWVIMIGDGSAPVSKYLMPSGARRPIPSDVAEAGNRLRLAKEPLLKQIRELRQHASRTTMATPIEEALTILNSAKNRSRYLVIGSDFIEDSERGAIGVEAPLSTGSRAQGVHVWLVLTYPGDDYLQRLRLSRSGLVSEVGQKWRSYFESLGASSISVSIADSILIGSRL